MELRIKQCTTISLSAQFSSAEVFNQHDIVFKIVHFRIEKPSAIGRDGETWRSQLKFFLDRRNLAGTTCGEVEEVNGGMGRRLWIHEVNAGIKQSPKSLEGFIQDEGLVTARHRHLPNT